MGVTRDNQSVVCLGDIIAKYAWKRYLRFLGFPKKCFVKKCKYIIDINWGCLKFEHKTSLNVQFDTEDDVLDSISYSSSALSGSRGSKQSESYVSADSDVGAPLELCSAKFENRRNKRRRFILSAEKETPVTVAVRFREFFTLDKQSNLQIDLPANLIPGDRNEHSFLITNARKQTFSNSYNWTINTGVIVKGCHKVRASCVVHEQQRSADLEVSTTVSPRNSCFPVVIRQQSDGKVVYTCFLTDLAEIFRSHTGPNLSLVEAVDDTNHKNSHVILTSRGTCKTTGWTDKQIIVSSESVLKATV